MSHGVVTGQVHHGRRGVAPFAAYAAAVLLAALGLAAATPAQAATPTVDRLSGANRYATSAAVSKASFPAGVPVAYVATGAAFPDGLAGSAVAGRDRAPLLLVTPSAIPSEVKTELERLAPGRIVVLGGTGAVSNAVESALEGYTTGSVTRLAGADRYATAAAASRASYGTGASNVFVATGASFPDALSGSAAAGAQKVPVLLVGATAVPSVTATELKRLKPAKITVLGGTGAVSAGVANALAGYTTGSVSRLSGADRYATSVAISKAAFPSATRALLASGSVFPDALSGGSVAAGVPGPLLLSRPTCVPAAVRTEITRLAASRVTLLGGTGVLSGAVASLTTCSSVVGQVCTNPYFTTSDSNGGVTDHGYYVHNNLWNASSYPGTKGTTQVCSYRSWNHIGTAKNNGDGAVKTYPNVHKDYSGRTISSFPRLTSRFAATSPGTGIYNVAYDLWLNGVPNDEVMIWTDNHKQVPAGSRFASGVKLGGYTWDVYATSGNGYLAFVPSNGARITSGTIDIKAMLGYLVSKGRVASSATVDQICYGVEIVDTGGSSATWRFTDFSITDS
ncbi:Glycosyl hydrolase family 12 [Pedococcus cremeus]|uniref:Glycosyl hydrolase family 12 n=1 Tax=Pedococcus cremeus TaxID=587636 RepID=A0A1H9WS05_9MICO|nr:Glycosyl hydrolase family 12 [Pedococcus cremeus]